MQIIWNKTQVHNTCQRKNQSIKNLKNTQLESEEASHWKMSHQHLKVLVQEDMFLKPVLFHHQRKTSQDGHCQKQEELLLKSQRLIGIKLTILVQPSDLNSIQKIEQGNKLILVQAIESKLRDLEHSRIKCKVELVSNCTIQNGESIMKSVDM